MINKYSNIASSNALKHHLSVEFDYEYLYHPEHVINGKRENSVAIITGLNQEKIQFGIWGILPHHYNDGWKQFQANLKTLETTIDQLKASDWLYDAFQNRRCLIIATGFYTSSIDNQTLVPHYNSLENNDIFCFAGIYNILDDGFITFSILSRALNPDNILETTSPIILDDKKYSDYLSDDFPLKKLMNKTYEIDSTLVSSQRISKKNMKNRIYLNDAIKNNDVGEFDL
ncbi:MAG: SOS response-associated peptidase family protein [Aquaticitalea sp.]